MEKVLTRRLESANEESVVYKGVAVVRKCLELQENQGSNSRIDLSDNGIVKMATDRVLFFNGAAIAYPLKKDHVIGMLSQIRREQNRN